MNCPYVFQAHFMNDQYFMKLALKEAERALEHGDVPVGAVIVKDNQVIAKAHNQVELLKDPTAHAEMLALTQTAETLKSKWLEGTTMYVTLEPCSMCAGALVLGRVEKLFYGAHDPKMGACGSLIDVLGMPNVNHQINVSSGLEENASESLLKFFFTQLRNKSLN